MKTTAILLLLLVAIGASAQTENGTSLNNATTMNATTTTLAQIPEPYSAINATNSTTTTSIATTTTIETPVNASMNETDNIGNVTIEPISAIENATDTTTTTDTTLAPITTTTLTPPTTLAPVCGNMYQEVGEECDTTGSACGAGRWDCISCRCVRLPDETTTTTATTVASVGLTLPDIGNISAIENIIPKGDNLFYLAVGAISVILIGFVVLFVLGKEHNGNNGKELKWK
jgi:hypothetical protein